MNGFGKKIKKVDIDSADSLHVLSLKGDRDLRQHYIPNDPDEDDDDDEWEDDDYSDDDDDEDDDEWES